MRWLVWIVLAGCADRPLALPEGSRATEDLASPLDLQDRAAWFDLAERDLAERDLRDLAERDLAERRDLGAPVDLTAPDDLTGPIDSSAPPDLVASQCRFDLVERRLILPAGAYPYCAATADLDGDGQLDAVICDALFGLDFFRGDNAGFTLVSPSPSAMLNVQSPQTLYFGDWNGDGRRDIRLNTMLGGQNQLFTLRGHGDFTFDVDTLTLEPWGLMVELADFDGDGVLDLMAEGSSPPGEGWYLAFWRGDTGGGFTRAGNALSWTGSGDHFLLGDLNEDGYQDLISFRGVELSRGNGSFDQPGASPGLFGSADTLIDLNGDGHLDLLDPRGFRLGHGDGTLGDWVTFGLSDLDGPSGTAVADFDGDGQLDLLLVASRRPGVTFLRGHGDATFDPPQLLGPPTSSWSSLAVGDFDQDGRPDVFAINREDASVAELLNRSCP